MKCVKRNERAGERGLNSGARKALKFRRGMRMREDGGGGEIDGNARRVVGAN